MKSLYLLKSKITLIVFLLTAIFYSQTAQGQKITDSLSINNFSQQDTVTTLDTPIYPVVLTSGAVSRQTMSNAPVSNNNSNRQNLNSDISSYAATSDNNVSKITTGDPLSHIPVQVQVNTDKSVGSIPMESSVTQNGSTLYSIPIECTPGRNGFQPGVSAVYNSLSGNGIIGYGWNIGGLSMIARTNANLYYNGTVSSMKMDNNDPFVLDGMHLLKVGSTTQLETEQGNIKIYPSISGSVISYFIAYFPNGATGTFGYTNNTVNQLFYPLTKLTDNLGNSIYFNYILRNNHYIIDNIQYGSNNKISTNFGKIQFTYKTRSDVYFDYVNGIKIQEDYLLDKITSYSSDAVIHTYSFNYVFNKVSFLDQVYCDNLNPLKFYYGYSDNVTASLNKTESTLTSYFGNTVPVIVNKGKFDYGTDDDALIIYPLLSNAALYFKKGDLTHHSISYYLSMYNPSQALLVYQSMADAWPLPVELTAGDGLMELSSGDFDGVPGDEVVKINNTVVNNKDRVTFNIYEPNLYAGLNLRYTRYYDLNNALQHYDSPLSFWPKKYFSADFNGDGKMEMLCVSMCNPLGQSDKKSKCTLIDLNNNTILFDANKFDYDIENDEIIPMDYDGDGKAEVCYINASGMNIYSFLQNGSSYDMTLVSTYNDIKRDKFKNLFVLTGDLNSDGKPDILASPLKSYYSTQQVEVPVWSPHYCPNCGIEYPVINSMNPVCRSCQATIEPHNVCIECNSTLEEGALPTDMYCTTHGDRVTRELTEYVDNGSQWSVYYGTGSASLPFVKEMQNFLNVTENDKFMTQDIDQDGAWDIVRKNGSTVYVYPTRNGILNVNSGDILSTSLQYSSASIVSSSISHTDFYNFLICIYNEHATKISTTHNEGKQRLLTGSVNSLGAIQKNYFNRLNDGYGITNPSGVVYSKGYNATFPFINYIGPLWVTSLKEAFLNGTKTGSFSYSYYNAIAHTQGLGFRGFEKITTQDLINGYSYEKSINPLNYGIPVKDNSTFSEVNYQATATVASNKKLTVKVNSLTATDKVKGTTLTSSFTYDSYLNLLTETVNYGQGVSSVTNQTYFNSATSPYVIGQPLVKTVTNTRNGSSWIDKEELAYYPNLLPKTKTIYTGSNGNLKTGSLRWTYDSNGNLTSEASVPFNVTDSLKTIFTYTSDGRYLLTKKNALNQVTTYSNYDKYGNAKTITNFKGQNTTYNFNEWGQPVSVVFPYGVTENFNIAWGGTGLYTVTTSETGKPTTVVHYDALNREVRNENQRFDGQWQKVDRAYDEQGRLQKVSLPFRAASASLWNTYIYDSFNRPTKLTEASGRSITWSYDGTSVSENANGVTSTKAFDATGQLISASDPGGTITYSLRPDNQPESVTAPGNIITTFGYDAYGRQITINDPSAGTKTFSDNYVNNLLVRTVTDANNRTVTFNYDRYGRITGTVRPEFNTTYAYNADGLPESESSTNGTSKTITYDSYGRALSIQENVPDNKYLKREYTYNNGNVETVKYTSNNGLIGTEYYTFSNGYNTQIKLNNTISIWKLNTENDHGQTTVTETGPVTQTYAYSQFGIPTGSVAGSIQNFSYNFDVNKGNLLSRINNNHGLTENFMYDALNRLKIAAGDTIQYNLNGNINYLPGTGTMTYDDANKPYAMTQLTPESNAVPVREQLVSYTSFMRPATITENSINAAFTYNASGDRVKMYVTQNSTPVLTRYYIGASYEADVQSGTERLYLGGDSYSAPAVYVKESGVWNLYYICRDHLGSITQIANADGTLKQELSYDAWGRLRDPATNIAYAPGTEPSLFLGRGFTGHEYLPWFGLINMNARLFDPALGRFLSPDPYVQTPDFTQSFNRYSYCLNNPLIFSDPTGEKWWHWLIGDMLTGGFYSITTITSVTSFTATGNALDNTVTYFGTLFKGDPEWGGKRFENSLKIIGGLFQTDENKSFLGNVGILTSRITWESLQTIAGFGYSRWRNLSGNVDDVSYYGGATLVNKNDNSRDRWGLTLGSYINSKNLRADPNIDPVFRHEYGHTLQSRLVGPLYLTSVGIPSLVGGFLDYNLGISNHDREWYETQANRMSYRYFSNHDPGALTALPWDDNGYPRKYDPEWYWIFAHPPVPFMWWLAF